MVALSFLAFFLFPIVWQQAFTKTATLFETLLERTVAVYNDTGTVLFDQQRFFLTGQPRYFCFPFIDGTGSDRCNRFGAIDRFKQCRRDHVTEGSSSRVGFFPQRMVGWQMQRVDQMRIDCFHFSFDNHCSNATQVHGTDRHEDQQHVL